MAETARERATRKEKDLAKLNTFGLTMRKQSGPSLLQRIKGDADDYGTSLGGAASEAMTTATRKAWNEGKSLLEMEPEVHQALREAAAEERREAKEPRKYSRGGKVSASKRADGIAKRGKTRGKMV